MAGEATWKRQGLQHGLQLQHVPLNFIRSYDGDGLTCVVPPRLLCVRLVVHMPNNQWPVLQKKLAHLVYGGRYSECLEMQLDGSLQGSNFQSLDLSRPSAVIWTFDQNSVVQAESGLQELIDALAAETRAAAKEATAQKARARK